MDTHRRLSALLSPPLPPPLRPRRVLGEANANLPSIVEVCVQVLAKGEKLIAAEEGRAMAVLLRQMQAALPAEVFAKFVAALKPKQQATLQAVLSEAA